MDMNEHSWKLFWFLQEKFPGEIDKELFYLIIKEGFTEEMPENGQYPEDPFHLSEMKAQKMIEYFSQLSNEGLSKLIILIGQKMAEKQ